MNIKNGLKLIKINIKESFIENKQIILLSSLLFIVPLFLGFLFPSNLGKFLDPILDAFKQKIINGDVKLTFDSIFINNFKAILIEYIGAIFFGLITMANLVFNGLLIGYFGSQIELKTFLLGIIPHGIFEIPGIIIGAAAGFILLLFMFKFIKDFVLYNSDLNSIKYSCKGDTNGNYYDDEYFKRYDGYLSTTNTSKRFSYGMDNNYKKLKQSITLFLIASILIAIAAIIETRVTLEIVHFFS
ncbi:MAG: stage II sporulation protein M [Methanobrevibacter sp.]|jgi:uncharacterized membrane protein SpoIIM required for sporulation|nr:stage II sporulation protein M [Candidatus Methanovirga basalitermitum]